MRNLHFNQKAIFYTIYTDFLDLRIKNFNKDFHKFLFGANTIYWKNTVITVKYSWKTIQYSTEQ